MNGDMEIWDEFKWEEFMKQQDKKVDRYMELFYRHQDDPDRDEIIASEMGWSWLLDDFKDTDDSLHREDDDAENDEGEGWKSVSHIDDVDLPEMDAFTNLPVYLRAKDFAMRAYRFVDDLPEGTRQDSSVVDFVANAMISSAKIAGGTGMGEDIDELGANIAYCKRGLGAANLAIAALHEIHEKNIVSGGRYLDLMKEAIEVRNIIAIHVVNLRETFRRGV